MLGDMSHGTTPDPGELLDPRAAGQVAETMQALATPSRLRILACLHEGPRSVTEISEAVGMDGSAVSHQLRILRHLGLVTGQRDGRRVNYSLYDHHVAQLLEQAMSHVEHLRLGLADGARREDAALAR
jgi:ArsR family transcriptional regulator, nickel/cobalt-responsive transcriptional repressor